MYGYIADSSWGRVVVLSDGRVFDEQVRASGLHWWRLLDKGVDIDAYTQEASTQWSADWTEIDEDEVARLLGDEDYFIGKVPPPNPLTQVKVGATEPTDFYSVSQAAALAEVTRRYVLDEIEAGRLDACKIGNQYAISGTAFTAWMDNPKRGSRAKKA